MKKTIFTIFSIVVVLALSSVLWADGETGLKIYKTDGSVSFIPSSELDYVEFVNDYEKDEDPANSWRFLGVGEFVDYMFFGSYETVEFYQNELYPNEFRLFNPYYYFNGEDSYFYFQILQPGMSWFDETITTPNLIYFENYPIAYSSSFYGVVSIVWPGSIGSISSEFASEDKWKHSFVKVYQENGLPGEIFLSPLYYAPDSGYWAGDTSSDETIHIIFPGYTPKDLSVDVEYEGLKKEDDSTFILANVTLGADVISAKVGVGAGLDTSAVVEGIENGSIDYVTISQSGEVEIPFSPSNSPGYYSIVAIAYNGIQSEVGYTTFRYNAPQEDDTNWTSLGYVDYTDGYLCANPMYFVNTDINPVVTYQVEIQENNDTPGLYRLVDPYGPAYPYSDYNINNSGVKYYLTIDATNPNQVTILRSPQDFNVQDVYALDECWSIADYFRENGYTDAEIAAEGVFGTYADGKITFPAKGLAAYWTFFQYPEDSGGPYYSNCVLDYDSYIASGGIDPYLYNPDGTLYAPFCIDMNTLTSTANINSRAANTAVNNVDVKKVSKNVTEREKLNVKDYKYRPADSFGKFNVRKTTPVKSNFVFEPKNLHK